MIRKKSIIAFPPVGDPRGLIDCGGEIKLSKLIYHFDRYTVISLADMTKMGQF